jgi:hypothetical protein
MHSVRRLAAQKFTTLLVEPSCKSLVSNPASVNSAWSMPSDRSRQMCGKFAIQW